MRILIEQLLFVSAAMAADGPLDVKTNGAFAFPQAEATIVCDAQDLRVSAWNDDKYLYVQAVIWGVRQGALGETDDGRVIGDTAALCVDADADGQATAKLDREYHLNPWPELPGLRHSIVLSRGSSTTIKSDSGGRGAIRFVPYGSFNVRVDSFVIPLAEIQRKPGDAVRFAYWGNAPKQDLTVDSVDSRKKPPYYAHHLPYESYHAFKLADRPVSLDVERVPNGRDDPVPIAKKPAKPLPKIGEVPPALAAADWPTLASLKGKVVAVDFWATWCAPCVSGIPRLNDIQAKYSERGLVVLGITDQSKRGIEKFQKELPQGMKYAVGCGSDMASEYGVSALPHVFVIGRDGKLLWHGGTKDPMFEKTIDAALQQVP